MNLDKLISSLEKNGIAAKYFENKEKAVEYLTSNTNIMGKKVVFGGSITLQEIGLFEPLSKVSDAYWHWHAPEADRKPPTNAAEVYMCSANGIAETGEIVNIDGHGNRIAGSFYTPKSSYFIIGVNKIKPDLTSAMDYARNVGGPMNARRLKVSTPCAEKADKCYDCNSPQRICRVSTIIHKRPLAIEHMEVVIIGENLGY